MKAKHEEWEIVVPRGRPQIYDEPLCVYVRIMLTESQAAELKRLKARGHSARDLLLAGMRKVR